MSENGELILARMIQARKLSQPDLDVLTFVKVEQDGGFSEQVRTYRQLWDNGQRVAQALLEAGMEQGDAFGLVMQNHPEFVESMIGSSIADTVFVPVDSRVRAQKLQYMLGFAECKGVIVADYAVQNLAEVIDELPDVRWVWIVDTGYGDKVVDGLPGMRRFSELIEEPLVNGELEIRATDPLRPMQMLYTSGTTGDPKAILSAYARFGVGAQVGQVIGLRADDRPYTGLSLTHANAQIITLGAALALGLRAVISVKFTKSRLWDITRRYGCTTFNLLGGMTTAIFAEPECPDDADNPVRFVLSAGMPRAIWTNFEQRFGLDIFEFYGAAEGGLTFNPPGVGPIGSVGRPPPSLEVKIFDEEDNECPPGVAGEIVFRNADGSAPVVSYYRNPEASAKKVRNGWLRMGDIGHRDKMGWLYFDYRMGGGIRRNGDFVNPAFVERELAAHPDVDDVFVYGLQGEHNAPGEKDVVAAIVPVDPTSFDVDVVFRHCRGALEANYVPSFIQVLDEIPKTASEKPQERFCAAMFEEHPEQIFNETNNSTAVPLT